MAHSSLETPASLDSGRGTAGYVWMISLVAAMGGLLFGYDWVVIGGAKPFFEPMFGISVDEMVKGVSKVITDERLSGWVNSCALLGCLVGSLVSGALSDKLGRKRLLLASAVLFAVSSVLTGWAPTLVWFVVWRIFGGVAIGMASNLSPIYIAEVAPAAMRGRLVALNQLTIVIGILAAQLINWCIARHMPELKTQAMIAHSWYGTSAWRWMFTAVTAPSLLFFFGMFAVPESPRWLIKNGNVELARRILAKIGGERYAAAEVANVQNTLAAEEIHRVRFADLFEPKLFKIVLIGCGLAILQQWCGINVMFNYAEEVFRSAGYGIQGMLKNIVWTGSVNLAFTFVALGVVDRGGRRGLMLFGAAGLALVYSAIGACYYAAVGGAAVLVLVLAAIACYAMSLAPVTWVLISEIFPNRIRGAAVSLAVSALWIGCFLLTYTFPTLNKALGAAGVFWLYAAICAGIFFFVLRFVPETKGKSLEQIERELVD
jgi:sugar porter (SP) family MFS transporter